MTEKNIRTYFNNVRGDLDINMTLKSESFHSVDTSLTFMLIVLLPLRIVANRRIISLTGHRRHEVKAEMSVSHMGC